MVSDERVLTPGRALFGGVVNSEDTRNVLAPSRFRPKRFHEPGNPSRSEFRTVTMA
jgi:hypothetical protein